MDIVATLFFIPMFLFAGLLIGAIHIFTGFGVLYALPVIALSIGAYFARKHKKMQLMVQLALTACIGQWLSFVSWLASRHTILEAEATRSWGGLASTAKAGFPFPALELPPSPMGSDRVPVEMWGGVFANHLIWFVVAFGIAAVIVHSKKPLPRKLAPGLIFIASLGVLYNLGLFTLWFD